MVTERAAAQDAPAEIADVCVVAVAVAVMSGAALTATSRAGASHVMCVTDDISELLEELQLTLGEGPSVDAAESGAPVLSPDLGALDATSRWPAFAPAASLAGAMAMFAFPLQIGAIQAGVLAMYRAEPGPLAARELGDALLCAHLATVLLLDSQEGAARGADGAPGPVSQAVELGQHRAQIDQATGMLAEQLGIGIDEAFGRLRAYAYAHDQRLADVASDIVSRRLRIREDEQDE